MERIGLHIQRLSAIISFKIEWTKGMIRLAITGKYTKEEAEQMKIPEFLKDLYEKDKRSAFFFTHYLNTGGLRKRLYSLSRVALVLMRLHSRGLAYSDLSHNNIFINNDEIPLVYLIDADNIEYDKTNRGIVYTPDYEVPEVVKGESNSLYSDIYSFAILSFIIVNYIIIKFIIS
jgi:serine/threonine protein kinase